jgi:Uma2 family endonuclease
MVMNPALTLEKISAPTPFTRVGGDQCVVLRDIDWAGYATMLLLRGERGVPRMTYLDGNLWLMSPSFSHERLAERLGLFVMEVVVGLDISSVAAGHTTFRRKKKRGGVEGDKTFYLANEERVRGKTKIDLRTDPPPDLAIEAVYTHSATPAVKVWRRLGVPEVWACDEDCLRILVLQANHRYVESETSAAFPFLTATEIFEWASRIQIVSETDWVKDVRRWVQETLVPRVRGQNG